MNRVLLLILIAGLTFLVVLFAMRPDLLDSVWLWLVGLSGAIIKGFHLIIDFFKDKFSSDKEGEKSSEQNDRLSASKTNDTFTGVTLKLLRQSGDETSTTGTLYLNNKYYCRTLEPPADTTESSGRSRVPAGVYHIQFLNKDSNLTLKYKEKYPEWFIRHLQLTNVPGLNEVVIHNAGDSSGINGFVVFNSLNIGNRASFLSNSTETYRRLYEFLSDNLNMKVPVQIVIYDEKWIEKLN